jgi:hypothetical protein
MTETFIDAPGGQIPLNLYHIAGSENLKMEWSHWSSRTHTLRIENVSSSRPYPYPGAQASIQVRGMRMPRTRQEKKK